MRIVGITGGIGSGKTLICKVFATLGIPVFHADDEARSLYETRPEILQQLAGLFGQDLIENNGLNKARLAGIVFNDPQKLQQLNQLIHPAVGELFRAWVFRQNAPYVLREAAILLESGSYHDCDDIILVTAPESIRVKRVMKRSQLSESEIRMRMSRQWSDDQKRVYANYEIRNDDASLLIPQILSIHQKLLQNERNRNPKDEILP
jgi:dephospho-CoA kinase